MLSIIIPIYNEEVVLRQNFDRLAILSQQVELIFIDGGSSDHSFDLALRLGKTFKSEKGRASQMNFGAKCAQHDILLFLHADNFIFPGTVNSIKKAMDINHLVGGCLTQRIDKQHFIFRVIETQGNVRARLSRVFYGDQGIFVRKNIFFQLGGFPEAPIMEDVIFSKRLRALGKTVVLSDRVFACARRWEKDGIIKTSLRYNLICLAYRLGIPLEKIKLFYKDIR